MACGLSQQELTDFGIQLIDGRCQGQAANGSLCGDLVTQHSCATRKLKAVIVGPAEAGTSTLFKQMTVAYGDGYAAHQRIIFLPIIVNNIVTALRALVREVDPRSRAQFPESWDFIVQDVDVITSVNVHHFLQIWNDPAIQDVQLRTPHANLAYFMQRLPIIAQANFVPSTEDYVWMHYPTRGLVYERQFSLPEDVQCKALYLGSARPDTNFGYDVNVVMFVANLATCRQPKALAHDLEFFERVCNSRSMRSDAEFELQKVHERYAARDHRPWDGVLLDSSFFPVCISRSILQSISAYVGRFLPIYYTSLTDFHQAQSMLEQCLKGVSL